MILEAAGGLQAVGEATTGRDAVWLTKKLQPDAIVMDVAMLRLIGLEPDPSSRFPPPKFSSFPRTRTTSTSHGGSRSAPPVFW